MLAVSATPASAVGAARLSLAPRARMEIAWRNFIFREFWLSGRAVELGGLYWVDFEYVEMLEGCWLIV